MSMFDWVAFDKGQARFCGSQRGSDGVGQDVFAVQMENEPPYYGEFDAKYESDGTNYNVEIISFGYPSKIQVGVKADSARKIFSKKDVDNISRIIGGMFGSNLDKPPPVHRNDRFLGRIIFRSGWIRQG